MVRQIPKIDFSREKPTPAKLVLRLNRALAPHGKAVGKTPKKDRLAGGGEFRLHDCRMSSTRYLSLSELESMARDYGVGITKANGI